MLLTAAAFQAPLESWFFTILSNDKLSFAGVAGDLVAGLVAGFEMLLVAVGAAGGGTTRTGPGGLKLGELYST